MGQDNQNKVLKLFYEHPDTGFTVREISKLAKMPRATVHKYLVELKKTGLVNNKNKASSNLFFRTKKINYFIEKIVECGFIDFIIQELNPSLVILFGSIRKGDSVKESDIDLFIESHMKKKVNLGKYEKKLGHKIQLFVEEDINNLQENLFNNVINGIKLYGSLKIK